MGDHRATIKIDFTIHNKTYRMDSWINWFDNGSGIDDRVLTFFSEAWADARARYDADQCDRWQREHAADIEQAERQELARLSAKYPVSG